MLYKTIKNSNMISSKKLSILNSLLHKFIHQSQSSLYVRGYCCERLSITFSYIRSRHCLKRITTNFV